MVRDGHEALTVRAAAEAAGTTTRAVYSLFGSKEGLVSALAERAFEVLAEGLAAVPETEDPAADLVAVGSEMYRDFVREHPSLFRVAFQRVVPGFDLSPELRATRARVWGRLQAKVARLDEVGLLGRWSVEQATVVFNAVCEGFGNAELRGGTLRTLPPGEEGRAWREGFEALVYGFTADGPHR